MDNLYLTNNARVVAVEGQVNLDDLLTSTAGGVIRAKSQGAVQQLVVQNVANQAFPMLQYPPTRRAGSLRLNDTPIGGEMQKHCVWSVVVDKYRHSATRYAGAIPGRQRGTAKGQGERPTVGRSACPSRL